MIDPVATAPSIVTSKPAIRKSTAPVRWSFVLAWAITAFSVLLALFAWLPWISPQVARLTPVGQLLASQDQADRLAAFESKLNALIATPLSQPDATPNSAPNAEAMKQDSIRAATEAATQIASQATAQLSATVQDKASGAALTAIAPFMTALRLENRLARGAAYQDELTQLTPLLSETERADLLTLVNGGTDNTVSLAKLDQKRRSLLAQYRENTATDWWGRVQAKLSGLITVKNQNDTPDPAEVAFDNLRDQIAHDATTDALASLTMLPDIIRQDLRPIEQALTERARAQAALASFMARVGTQPLAVTAP